MNTLRILYTLGRKCLLGSFEIRLPDLQAQNTLHGKQRLDIRVTPGLSAHVWMQQETVITIRTERLGQILQLSSHSQTFYRHHAPISQQTVTHIQTPHSRSRGLSRQTRWEMSAQTILSISIRENGLYKFVSVNFCNCAIKYVKLNISSKNLVKSTFHTRNISALLSSEI